MRGVQQMIANLHRRVMLSVGRAVIRAVSDDPKMQELQAEILKGEVRNNLERFQNYGYTSVPHPGAEGVVVFVGGNRDHGLVVAVDDRRYRLKGLKAGEVAMYTDEGDFVHFKRGNEIHTKTKTLTSECDNATLTATDSVTINCVNATVNASTKTTINSPETETTGNLTVGGNIAAAGNVSDSAGSMQGMRDTYNGHGHPETGSTTENPNEQM